MKRESLRGWVWGWMMALLVATALAFPGAAQEPPAKKVGAPAAKAATETPPASKKPRGRLPTYYAKVVSQQQREEIYEIQAKYNDQIEKLKEELTSLTAKRDAEVEGVLTDTQRAEVAKLQQARKSRSSTTTAEESAESSGQ